MTDNEINSIFASEKTEAVEYQGKKVTLNQPRRIGKGDPGYGKKKFYVYVKNERGNVVRVMFGDPNLEIKRDNPNRRKNFRSRHGCDNPGPKWKARYWSCRMWEAKKSVTDYTSGDIFKKFIQAIQDSTVIDVLQKCKREDLMRYVPDVWEYYFDCIGGSDSLDESLYLSVKEVQEIVCRMILYLQYRNTPLHISHFIGYFKQICELTKRGWPKEKIIRWTKESFRFILPEEKQIDRM